MEHSTNGAGAPETALAENDPADVREMSGLVKWYDDAKGFGFVVPADGGPDIFLGKAVVALAGLGIPQEGSGVDVMVQTRQRGCSATALLRLDPPDPERLESLRAARRQKPHSAALTNIEGPRRGVVKLFNAGRGFGFVTLGDGTADIFFHVTTQGTNLRSLAPGDEVDVRWGSGPNGLTAVEMIPAVRAEERRTA